MSISCPRPAQVLVVVDYDLTVMEFMGDIMDDWSHRQPLFPLILPHLTFFLDVTTRCNFMSEELKDSVGYGTSISGSLKLRLRKCCAC